MVFMAGGFAHGRVRKTTATAESPNMAAMNWLTETYSFGLFFTSLILDIHAMIN